MRRRINIFLFGIIFFIGLILRLYFFPYNIPLILDGLKYFIYANNVVFLGQLPTSYDIANNGFPIFLSFFFGIFNFDTMIDYMNLQRALTVTISLLTVFPIYFLCRKFFSSVNSVIGSAIYLLEPRTIINSTLGLSDSLYIFLVSLALTFFFSSKAKFSYISFFMVAFATLVRAEGFFVFLPMILIIVLKNRKDRIFILKMMISVLIFTLVIIPLAIYRINATGNDSIIGRIFQESDNTKIMIFNNGFENYLEKSFHSIINLLLLSLFPYFIFLIPVSLYILRSERMSTINVLFIFVIFMILPVIYAFSVTSDTRYMYPLYPIFTIISLFLIKKLKIENNQIIISLIIIGILTSSSVIFLNSQINNEYQMESFLLAQRVVKIADGVNSYHPEDSFLESAILPNQWSMIEFRANSAPTIISTDNFKSLIEFINSSKEKGLTHLIIDDRIRPNFLTDVFNEEKKYSFLKKIYDSTVLNNKYHVKIFYIDFDELESTDIIS